MKKFSPFALLIAALFFSCGDEIIQTIYVPDTDTVFIEKLDTLVITDTDTVFLTRYDTIIVYANCDHPFAIGDTFDLESGPYFFEEDSSFIALQPPFDPLASGATWDFGLFHHVYGDPDETFLVARSIRIVCGYLPTEEELAYLFVDSFGYVYLWAIQINGTSFEVSIIYPIEEFMGPYGFAPTKHLMVRRGSG